ncbi:LysR substrate-binding domain-containing protein [Undibacterium sp. Ji50W]|uniref:LysR substrate-binding domain-containing protein n=1 Tax=Undibacterium sp. Ji50W TaxID=3413041 RepID=UPI003BF08E78
MKEDLLNLKALRAFYEIVRTGSVTAAATRIGMSQPAVSRQLAQLEALIGFELFHRDHGRLVPTQDGLLLYEEVSLSLNGFQRIQSLVSDISGFRIGHLKLVAPPSFCEGILPDIVAAFSARFPRVRISVDSHSREVAKSMIATRTVDGGFLIVPVNRDDLHEDPVCANETVCVLQADNPLARHRSLTPKLLRGEPLILLGYGQNSRATIDATFSRAGVQPDARIETHTVSSACAFAARGLGVALVNRLLAAFYMRPGLVMRRFEPTLSNEYAFVTSSLSTPSRLATEFLKETKRYFANKNLPEL